MVQDIVATLQKYIRQLWFWVTSEIRSFINLPWQELPIWKWYLAVVAGVAIACIILWAIFSMWEAIVRMLRAMVDFLYALVWVLPWFVLSGLIAYATLFVIRAF